MAKRLDNYIDSILVKDDGHDVSLTSFENKILEIGTTAKTGGQGVGRFGAVQIGKQVSNGNLITAFDGLP